MESVVKTDEKIVKLIARQVTILERNNLKTKELSDAQIVAEIKKIISDVISNVNKKMPTYKHIKNFVIRDKEFEKTTTKKIKRYGNNLKND